MATREIVVTVDENDWGVLHHAADCAGMCVEAYASWGMRLLALQARSEETSQHRAHAGPKAAQTADESESVAWVETFAERLSHRADQFRND
ncbi:hypothetical protein [Nocardia sp. NPDC059228]|uniref:hypothetical protein n=1 Tax=Nocardia sp. NPDC059228 TaxID=3346777 RepID=UPI0036970C92